MSRRKSWRDGSQAISMHLFRLDSCDQSQVTGVNVFSAGEFIERSGDDIILFEDEGAGSYKKLVVAEDRLRGAVLSATPRTGSGISI